MKKWSFIAASVLGMAYAASACAASTSSAYSELSSDVVIGSSDTAVLVQSITLSSPQWVYLESDGRVFPSGGDSSPAMYISVDGSSKSNLSVVDWSVSTNSQQHAYNAIGAVYLAAGAHTVALHAKSLNSISFTLGADSNLITMVNPASNVQQAVRGADSGTLSYNVNGLAATDPIPFGQQVTMNVGSAASSGLILMASSRIYEWGNPGDPLVSIGLDGNTLPNNQSSWSDNDMNSGAENQAPFFAQAYVGGLSSSQHQVSLLTSALPYAGGNDTVQYRIGGDARIVALYGDMKVFGSSPQAYDAHNVTNYQCIATSINWSGCPQVGSAVVLAQADITIPSGSNGIVLFTGKTRIQADTSDSGGVAYLYLTIDGQSRGSVGVQQLQYPNAVSTRTLSASYMASGSSKLSPGVHHVVLYAKATGSFKHLAVTKDLPLVWFD